MPVIPSNLVRDLDDSSGRVPLVKRFGSPGLYQYVYQYGRQWLPATLANPGGGLQPFAGVRTCAPCDRFALSLGKIHGATSALITQFDMEIWAGWDYVTERVFQGTSKLTNIQNNGLLVLVTGFPATGWDIWLRLNSATQADNFEIELNLLLDHGGGPFAVHKGSLML